MSRTRTLIINTCKRKSFYSATEIKVQVKCNKILLNKKTYIPWLNLIRK